MKTFKVGDKVHAQIGQSGMNYNATIVNIEYGLATLDILGCIVNLRRLVHASK